MLKRHPSVLEMLPVGFSLIELIVVISILSILLMKAMPSYSEWIANTRVRTTAESIQTGLMLAKAEAVKRNAKVQFVLTNTSPTSANVNTVTASTNGKLWMVRVYQSGGVYTSSDYIQGRLDAEGSNTVTVAAGQSTFVFTGVGGLSPIPGSTVSINVSASNATRSLRVNVDPGGAVRMCDPGLSLTTSAMGC